MGLPTAAFCVTALLFCMMLFAGTAAEDRLQDRLFYLSR